MNSLHGACKNTFDKLSGNCYKHVKLGISSKTVEKIKEKKYELNSKEQTKEIENKVTKVKPNILNTVINVSGLGSSVKNEKILT